MDATEVTVGQFKKFLKSTDHPFDGELWNEVYKYSPTDKHPMIRASWHDVTAYAKWVGKRLPTEKEWEFAARGGLVGKEYSWGDDEAVARDYANFAGTDGKDKWGRTTAPVGSFKPNGYGLFDMSGNVWEWCTEGERTLASKFSLFLANQSGNEGVLRGGSWDGNPVDLRAAIRYGSGPTSTGIYSGFRCVSGFPAAKQ